MGVVATLPELIVNGLYRYVFMVSPPFYTETMKTIMKRQHI